MFNLGLEGNGLYRINIEANVKSGADDFLENGLVMLELVPFKVYETRLQNLEN